MTWEKVLLGDILVESKNASTNPDADKRITVRLNCGGVEKRPFINDKSGATKYYIRSKGQFIYGKQNLHNGAFGVIPDELDGFESSGDLPAFDINPICKPEWIVYFFKQNGFYKTLTSKAKGVGTKRIYPQQIYSLKIPLPPINEQERILGEITKSENLVSNLNDLSENNQDLVSQLRQSILQDAIQGKLLPQNPDDEPASKLIERIKAEKEALIRDKKISRPKPLSPIKAEEIPFTLPNGWEWVRLGEIAMHNTGKTLHKGKNTGKYRKYITTSNLYWGYFELKDLREMQIEDHELERFTALKGDLLICEGGDAGRSAIWEEEYSICFQNHIHRVRLFGSINVQYLFYYIKKIYSSGELDVFKKGIGIKGLSGKELSNIPVPLPPLAEQERIVAKVDELMSLCDQLQEQIDSAKEQGDLLMESVLSEVFR